MFALPPSLSLGNAIGADGTVKPVEESGKESDLFATFGGNSVTLQSRHGSRVVSDFLTEEDAKELREERLEKERRRQAKMLEKMRKKDGKRRKTKKDKKKRRRKDDNIWKRLCTTCGMRVP